MSTIQIFYFDSFQVYFVTLTHITVSGWSTFQKTKKKKKFLLFESHTQHAQLYTVKIMI